jgi:hypothetical protein
VLLSCVDESTTQTVQQMSEISDPNFLAEYEKESAWAEGHGVSQRTVARYRELGLPHLFFGGYIWIPRLEGRAWIASRVKRRNPSRRRKAAAPISATQEVSA